MNRRRPRREVIALYLLYELCEEPWGKWETKASEDSAALLKSML